MDVHPVKTTSVMRNSLLKNTGAPVKIQIAAMVAEGSERRQGKGNCGVKLWGESRSFGETQGRRNDEFLRCLEVI